MRWSCFTTVGSVVLPLYMISLSFSPRSRLGPRSVGLQAVGKRRSWYSSLAKYELYLEEEEEEEPKVENGKEEAQDR